MTPDEKLTQLSTANSGATRTKWALEQKKKGKKVIGVIDQHIPEELIHAAGMLPYRITGTWKDAVPLAQIHLHPMSDKHCQHVLESVMEGELDFLDGIVITGLDDTHRCLYDIIAYLEKYPLCHVIYLPNKATSSSHTWLAREFGKFRTALENLAGAKITNESIENSVQVYNKMRSLLTRLYDLRRKEWPSITGAECLGITLAARIMPKEEFNQKLEELLPSLENRKAPLKKVKPRLMIHSDFLDDPAYISLIEDIGAVVAMDNLDTGSRYFWGECQTTKGFFAEDALAHYYLPRPGDSHVMDYWDDELNEMREWVRYFDIDGVVSLPLFSYFPTEVKIPWYNSQFTEAGIPHMTFRREYQLANAGQLRTRIQAFIEVLAKR